MRDQIAHPQRNLFTRCGGVIDCGAARMVGMESLDRRVPLAAGLDTAVVVLFVAIGKREHEQDSATSGLIITAAPFLIALVFAWMALRVWKRPADWRTGIGVWAIVLVVGMLLRNIVFDDGTATAFIVVAAGFLGFFLVGWRLVLMLAEGRLGYSPGDAVEP
jgi:hypothetical protein